MDPAVRFSEGSEYEIEGLLVPFSGPFPGDKDTYGTRFGPFTDFALSMFRSRPLLWHHGQDEDPGIEPVGEITDLSIRADLGVWMKAALNRQSEYFDALRQMIDAKKLFLSSGSVPHLVKIDARSGDVLQWPVFEGSLTPTPANTHAFVLPADSFRAAFRSAGFEDIAEKIGNEGVVHPDAIRAKLDAAEKADLADADFAYIDANGGRHLPINDADHVKAALARFNQTKFESQDAKSAAWDRIVAKAKALDIDVSAHATRSDDPATRANAASDTVDYERSFEDIRDDINGMLNHQSPFMADACCWSYVVATFPDFVIVSRSEDGDQSYWKIAYTLDANSEPVLGESTEMNQVYVPAAARSAAVPLTLDADSVTRRAAALTARTKDLQERRDAEGRPLSPTNRRALRETAQALRAAGDAVVALANRADGQEAEAARVARFADPDARRVLIEVLELEASL